MEQPRSADAAAVSTSIDVEAANLLYYGDNLDVMRRHLKDETVDWRVVDPWLGPQGKQIAVFTARLNDGTTISIDGPFESTYMYGMVEALVTE